jgi:deoxyxylulose-5-phosphate synthase
MMLYAHPSIQKCNVYMTLDNAGIYGADGVTQEYYQKDANIYKMATIL